jgi:nitric oxide reductase subunit C
MNRKSIYHLKETIFRGIRHELLGIVCLSAFSLVGCATSGQSAPIETPTFTSEQALGEQVFEHHCQSCHSTIPDSIVVGPSLAGVAQRAANRIEGMNWRDYIEMSISQPSDYLVEGYPDLMPSTLSDILSKEEVEAVLAYLMTLEE